jgi:hypothetical protein
MRKTISSFSILLIAMTAMQMECSVPRRIWPQKDIAADELLGTKNGRVLVAARSSEFKIAVIAKLRDELKKDSVTVKLVGIDGLQDEKVKDYSAVVILNTCLAWGMDRKVGGFLDDNPDQKHVIILTTSGDGKWMPDMKDQTFDAVATASKEDKTDEVAGILVSKIRALLKDQPTTQ